MVRNFTFQQKLSRANGSHLVIDATSVLQVLDIHSQYIDILQNSNGTYYYIKVNEEKMWIPILPGFSIFTNIKNNILLKLVKKKKLFSWINFGENANDLSNTIASNAQSDRFIECINL